MRTVTLSTIQVKTMNDNITVTLDNNPGLEARISYLENQERDLRSQLLMWKQRTEAYEILLLKLYSRY